MLDAEATKSCEAHGAPYQPPYSQENESAPLKGTNHVVAKGPASRYLGGPALGTPGVSSLSQERECGGLARVRAPD
jgi:hypothetical protein